MRRSIRVIGNKGSRRNAALRVSKPLLHTRVPAALPSALNDTCRILARRTLGTLGLHGATAKESCA